MLGYILILHKEHFYLIFLNLKFLNIIEYNFNFIKHPVNNAIYHQQIVQFALELIEM